MRVVVTGGAGFIGANLVRRFEDDGVDVTVIDDFSTGLCGNLTGCKAEVWEGSILDPDMPDALFESAQSVIHLAAVPSVPRSLKDPLKSHEANATGTVRILEAARRAKSHVIVASSSSVYGANPQLPKREDMMPKPVSPYAVSKLAAESYAISYQRVFHLPTLAFRFFNVYGPGQMAGHAYAAVIPAFVDNALHDRPLQVHGDGEQTRDFTFVETVTEVLASAAMRRLALTYPVNLAFGTRSSLKHVISLLQSEVGKELQIDFQSPRPGDVRDSQADNSALRELFPDVAPVPLVEGLRRTIQWMSKSSDLA